MHYTSFLTCVCCSCLFQSVKAATSFCIGACCYLLPVHVGAFSIFPHVCMLCVNLVRKENSQHLSGYVDAVYVSLYMQVHSASFLMYACCVSFVNYECSQHLSVCVVAGYFSLF